MTVDDCWLVTVGSYDYHVLAVFTTRKAAEAFAERTRQSGLYMGEVGVERADLNPPSAADMPRT